MTAPGPDRICRTVVAAAAQFGGGAFDLLGLSDIQLELPSAPASDNGWFSARISALSQQANKYCGRVLVAQSYVEQVWPFCDPYPWQSPQRTHPLRLSNWPLTAPPNLAGTAPPATLTLSTVAGGALPARAYFVRATYATAAGETAPGIEASIMVPSGQYLSVAAPGPDRFGAATSWSVYVGASAGGESQQAAGLALASPWVESGSGVSAGAPMPDAVLAVENVNLPFQPQSNLGPTPLCEGREFVFDAGAGMVQRIGLDGYPRSWDSIPLAFAYRAGFSPSLSPPNPGAFPADLTDALVRMLVGRYMARGRDPALRSETIPGVLSASYVAPAAAEGGLPADVQAMLDAYRVPVIA